MQTRGVRRWSPLTLHREAKCFPLVRSTMFHLYPSMKKFRRSPQMCCEGFSS